MRTLHFKITATVCVLLAFLVTADRSYGGSPGKRKDRKKNAAGLVVWQSFGNFPSLDGECRAPGLTTGIEAPNVWTEGPLPDTVAAGNDYLELTSPFEPESFYAPVVFDKSTAYEEGWYTCRVLEPFNNAWHLDSVYVWFDRDSSENGSGSLIGGELEPALIVNLVAVDASGYTRFKILNLERYNRAEVQLFNRSGRLIYQSRDYKNDFDFASWPADTYYYKVTLCSGVLRMEQKGFVEVIKKR